VVAAVAVVIGLACVPALANALFNTPPRGVVPGKNASLSTVAHTYMEAARSQDCGMTRALTSANTWAWCDDPRLLSYQGGGPTPSDDKCIAYMVTITASSDGSMHAGTEPWSLCFRQTDSGWRLWDQGQG